MDNLRNALSREGLFTEPALDIIENFRVRRVRLVQQAAKADVCRAQTVTEVLCEDPTTVCENGKYFRKRKKNRVY